MKLVITIHLDNAAFDDGHETYETARILTKLTSTIADSDFVAELDDEVLRDINGNICGQVKVVKE